jgi:selenocysteine-specific elongation factor
VHVVATAGHVDHGKSSLVLALTGTDPDRFAEEKERGLTIDLGFAWTTLPSGRELAFVDVPGHVRFLRNMLAGVGAVEACLFVVAATEVWKPQSEEHLRILDVLGIEHGVLALTKVGLVDAERRAAARIEVLDRVAGTFLEKAPLVEVDAVDGTGLDELRRALDDLAVGVPAAVDRGRPRLWVDRSFAARGAGTVVTGTLAGGTLAVGDELVLAPLDLPVRVRGLQTHKASANRVEPGRRVAVNLVGVTHDLVARGHALVRAGQWAPTRTVDCSLTVLPTLDHDVSRRGAYVAYLGSGEHPVTLRVLGTDRIAAGGHGFVRLHLPEPVPLLPGDRYALRESGRSETVGGGEVLDVAPVLPAATATPSRSVDRVVVERGWVHADELERLTGERRAPTVGSWVVAPAALAEAEARLREAVTAAGPTGLDTAGLDERDRAVLVAVDDILIEAGRARPTTVEPTPPHPYLDALAASPFTPPAPDGVDRVALRDLVRRGLAIERDGVWFAASAVDAASRVVARLLAEAPEGITASAVREALGTSRKYVLPLLGHLDATGVTRRRGDLRIAGPRLPAIEAGTTRQSDPPRDSE